MYKIYCDSYKILGVYEQNVSYSVTEQDLEGRNVVVKSDGQCCYDERRRVLADLLVE